MRSRRDRLDDPAGDRHACSRAGGGTGVVAKSPQQRQLEQKIICMCGSSGCVHSTLNCPMRPVCHGHTAQRKSDASQRKDLDQTLAAFVEMRSGGSRCAGKHRLQRTGLVVALRAGFRRPGHDPADRSPLVSSATAVAGGGDTQIDPSLDARLDDELETSTESSFTGAISRHRDPTRCSLGSSLRWPVCSAPPSRCSSSRGQSPAAVIILSLAVFAAAAVGIAALRTVMPLTSKARPEHAGARRPHACGARARQSAGAPVDQGARIRSRDGEGLGEGFRRDERPLASTGGATPSAARCRCGLSSRSNARSNVGLESARCRGRVRIVRNEQR